MIEIHSAMLLTDWLIYGLFIIAIGCFFWIRRQPHLREPWSRVLQNKIGVCVFIILIFYVATGLLDSIRLEIIHKNPQGQITSTKTKTILDLIVSPLGQEEEETYSAPFAMHLFTQSLITLPNGKEIRSYPRLEYAGAQLKNSQEKLKDIIHRVLKGFAIGLTSFVLLISLLIWLFARRQKLSWRWQFKLIFTAKTKIAWREGIITFGILWIIICIFSNLALAFHIFGTDKVGRDVFYEAIKSIRTGLLIGTLTTIFMLPFALFFGTLAGYFRGWVDDIIQYLYTTLSSIPGVLLISATILVMQVYIANHPDLFPTIAERADARLLALTIILGITSWASLCRFLRGETLKLRNLEYVQAARALGVKQRKIIIRHIIPNVMHIVLITLVLDFSGLVLAEAVLSYVGIGVDPTTMSWGNMINSSRLELAREPAVWWPLLAALIFMFILVLSANLFADTVRDAFDPYLRHVQ